MLVEIITGKPTLRATQIEAFFKCPEMYRRRYIEEEIVPPGIALIKGTAVHKGAAVNFVQKIDSHEDLPEKEIKELTASAFDDCVSKEGVGLTNEELSEGRDNVLGNTKDRAVGLAGLYSKEVAPRYQPVAVEEQLEVDLEACVVTGRPDVIIDTGLMDMKTGKRWNQEKADGSIQLSVYAVNYLYRYSRMPTLGLEILVENKTPVLQTLETTRAQRDFDALVNRVNRMLECLEKGIFIPAPDLGWWCGPKWCGFWNTCKYTAHG